MAFLTKEDLISVCDIEIIDIITNGNNEITETIINESIDKMKSFLSRRYDIDTIFSAIGADRKSIIVKYLKDIVIFEIYERHSREGANEVVERRYTEAMAWLGKINNGEFADSTLPPKPKTTLNTSTDGEDIRFGSNKNYTSIY